MSTKMKELFTTIFTKMQITYQNGQPISEAVLSQVGMGRQANEHVVSYGDIMFKIQAKISVNLRKEH